MEDKIVKQSKEYNIAIGMSVQIAAKGRAFANEALEICDHIHKEQVPVGYLDQSLNDMVHSANLAHESAATVIKQFKQIRGALQPIKVDIPQDVETIKRARQDISFRSSTGRGTNTTSFDEILTRIEQAKADLAKLVEHVGHFVDWWDLVQTSLGHLLNTIPRITHANSNPLREEVVRTGWETVGDYYVQYQRISTIMAHYPTCE